MAPLVDSIAESARVSHGEVRPAGRLFRRIIASVVVLLLPSTAAAQSTDAREPHATVDGGLSFASQPSPSARSGFDRADQVWPPVGGLRAAGDWWDPAPVRLPLPLPEASPASRLRWEIASAAPVSAPPPASGFTGWLPSVLLAGAFAATEFALDPPEESRWRDRDSFDRRIQRSLRGGSRDTREAAAIASDVLVAGMGTALVADWWWLREEYGFLRSLQVETRWILADNVATGIAKVSAGRRAVLAYCEFSATPDGESKCGGRPRVYR